MSLRTRWIPVLTPFLLLLYFCSAKVSASGTSEEETIDTKYVIIGVALGVFLTIGFLALKFCIIKRQVNENDLVESDNRMDRRSPAASSGNREVKLQEQQNAPNH